MCSQPAGVEARQYDCGLCRSSWVSALSDHTHHIRKPPQQAGLFIPMQQSDQMCALCFECANKAGNVSMKGMDYTSSAQSALVLWCSQLQLMDIIVILLLLAVPFRAGILRHIIPTFSFLFVFNCTDNTRTSPNIFGIAYFQEY